MEIVWLSGQINIDAGDDIVSQTRGTLDKIDALLADAGTSKHDLVFVQVLLKTMDFYAPMNEVYGAWLEGVDVKPTRAAFAVDALPADALVEIVVQAVRAIEMPGTPYLDQPPKGLLTWPKLLRLVGLPLAAFRSVLVLQRSS